MAKGGRESNDATMPKFFETALQQSIGMGQDAAAMPYAEYRGPDVAAFSPMQEAAFRNQQNAMNAFGMQGGQGGYMPTPVNAGGAIGYSSAPVYDQARQNLQTFSPATAEYIPSFGIDPVTGEMGSRAPDSQPVALEMTSAGRRGGK
tara:strand:+ start:412 stop:852 length:441 start_codon:yes stop_codon:yes gene_type:complete